MTHQLLNGYLYKRRWVVTILRIVDDILRLLPIRHRKLPAIIKKILIVKPDHLGDAVLSSSALSALKKRFPGASIDYVAGPWSQPVLRYYSEINKIWLIRHAQNNRTDRLVTKWIIFFWDLCSTIPKIRREKYDAVLFLRAFGGNLVFLSRFLNARFLAGHGTGGGGPLLDAEAQWVPERHELDHYREVLEASSIETAEMAPYFPVQKENSSGLNLPADYVCIHPGAGTELKKLSHERWREILREDPRPVVVCGSKDEVEWVSRAGLTQKVFDYAGKLSILELSFVFQQASVIHVLDSFPAHLAAVSNDKSVSVHFRPSSDPIQWSPVGSAVRVVSESD